MLVAMMTGLVLAGGESRRMGADKALLDVGGERLVDRVVARLRGVCDPVLVAPGARPLPGVADGAVADAVVCIEPRIGPLAGLIGGLEAAATDLVAVVAVDLPFASASVLDLLARRWDGAATAVAPRADGRVQPLHAVYARAAVDELRALLDAGQRSPTAALDQLHAAVIEPEVWRTADPSGAFARNINTPEDLRALGLDAPTPSDPSA